MDLQQASRDLTIHHPYLTFEEASRILLHAYRRLKPARPYGNLLATCLKIEWGILLRSSEKEIMLRLEQALKAS